MFHDPIDPFINTFSCCAGNWEGDQVRIQHLDTLLEVIHIKFDIRKQIDFVDDQCIDVLVHSRVFIRFVIPLGDGGDQDIFIGAQLEGSRTNEVSHIFYKKQIKIIQVEFHQGITKHVGVNMALAASVDLDCCSTGFCCPVCVYAGSDITVNSSDLTSQGQIILRTQAVWLNRNAQLAILVEGHADERGTREYNVALGAQRAARVQQFLISEGVSASRIRTVSYGKERPVEVCAQQRCWDLNRRAVVVVSN